MGRTPNKILREAELRKRCNVLAGAGGACYGQP